MKKYYNRKRVYRKTLKVYYIYLLRINKDFGQHLKRFVISIVLIFKNEYQVHSTSILEWQDHIFLQPSNQNEYLSMLSYNQ